MTTREYITELTGYELGFKNALINFFAGLLASVALYIPFLIGTVILMFFSLAYWMTDETSWLDVLAFALIAPGVLAVFVYLCMVIKEYRAVHLLETFLENPTQSPRMQEADKYLYSLLSSDRLKERNYPKVRKARAACFKDGRIVSRTIRDYCQILYDIDPEYAQKNDFQDPNARQSGASSSCKAASAADPVTASAASSGTSGVFGSSRSSGTGATSSFYIPPSGNSEDDDSIALDMEEAIDDDIMFHGGNPFDWDTRSDYMDDPLGFGGDDGDGWEDW